MFRRSILALALCSAPQCLAAGWSERWTASSTTASSITGDVTLKTSRIVFANGRSLDIEKVRNVSFTDDIGKTGPATLYRITKPGDPTLLQGNRFCGGGQTAVPVTYVVIWRTQPIMPGEAVGRALAVYSAKTEPLPSAGGSCGIFRYELAR